MFIDQVGHAKISHHILTVFFVNLSIQIREGTCFSSKLCQIYTKDIRCVLSESSSSFCDFTLCCFVKKKVLRSDTFSVNII